jgi:steroid delta-isomerase
MATPDDIRSTITSYIERFSAADRAGWLALFADGATLEDPVGSEVRSGTVAIGEFWDLVRSMTPDITLASTGPVRVAGHEAAFPMVMTTQLGDTAMALDIIDVMTFDDDAKIASMRAFWDMADMRPA